MTIMAPKIFSKYGAIDSASYPGEAVSAGLLRPLAMSANRLLCQGEPMLVLLLDGHTGNTVSATNVVAVTHVWQQLYWAPLRLPKKTICTKATVKVEAIISGSLGATLQICTAESPFRGSVLASDTHYLRMQGNGTGTWQTFTANNVTLARTPFESLTFYLRGEGTGTTADPAVTGTPTSGVVGTLLMQTNALFQSGSAWLDAGIGSGSHYIVFTDTTTGGLVASPRIITSASNANMNVGVLTFAPPLGKEEAKLAQKGTFTIKKINTARFASISIYTDDVVP